MRKLLVLIGLMGLMSVSGCILVPAHGHGRHQSASRAPQCHPSQYWDGHQCKHKGKGHGARKHDGR